jgi:predicted Zn-dependent peptidase
MRNSAVFAFHHHFGKHPYISRVMLLSFQGIFLLLFLPSFLLAQNFVDKVQRLTLKNGLRLIMLERHLSPTIAIYIRYRSGALDEADGKTGTAHMLEHMMFKGTRTIGTRDYRREEKILNQIVKIGTILDQERAKAKAASPVLLARLTAQLNTLQKEQQRFIISNEIDRLYTENGAVGLNASTGQDLTTYKVSIPANRIELWARIESDRMVHPVFREFYTERNVVMEERRQRAESDPDGKLLEAYLATAFLTHPYRRPVLGWPSDMNYLDMDYMQRFFKNTHAPNNTVIAIVGDIQPAAIRKIVEKYFDRISPQKFSHAVITEEPRQQGERRIDVIFAAEPQMILGYHKPPPPVYADYVFDIIESILTRGRTSRLFKTLVDEKRIAENIQAANGLPGSRYPNQFVLFATPRSPHGCRELEQAIDQEIEKLRQEPVSEKELEKVKNQIRADYIRGLDSNEGLAGMLSYYEALLGDFHYMIDYTGIIDRITPQDILQVAQTFMVKDNRTVATLVNKY